MRPATAWRRFPPAARYGAILADPAWQHEGWPESGRSRSALNQYPTSATNKICARPTIDIAAPDSVLFLWAVAPLLPDALHVMAAWGFTYQFNAVWRTFSRGNQKVLGHWIRGHDHLLMGTRGNPPCLVFQAAVRGHSVKPDFAHELIEAYFPNLPKFELNARRARDGWEIWGYEASDKEGALD